MRVTTGMVFDTGISTIQKQTASLLHTQQQVSTGRRIVSRRTIRVASARALEVGQSSGERPLQRQPGHGPGIRWRSPKAISARSRTCSPMRARAVEAGNGSYSQSEFDSIAADLRGQFRRLGRHRRTVAMRRGLSVCGATRPTPSPSSAISPGALRGDQGDRTLQVSASRNIPVSSNGEDLFVNIPGRGPAATCFR